MVDRFYPPLPAPAYLLCRQPKPDASTWGWELHMPKHPDNPGPCHDMTRIDVSPVDDLTDALAWAEQAINERDDGYGYAAAPARDAGDFPIRYGWGVHTTDAWAIRLVQISYHMTLSYGPQESATVTYHRRAQVENLRDQVRVDSDRMIVISEQPSMVEEIPARSVWRIRTETRRRIPGDCTGK